MLHEIVAYFSFIIGILILVMFFRSFYKIKKVRVLLDVALAFLLVSFIFIIHALVEMLEISDGYYTTTGLMAIMALAYIIIVLRYKSPFTDPVLFNFGRYKHGGKKLPSDRFFYGSLL